MLLLLGDEDDKQVSGLGPKLGQLLGCGKKATARERKIVGLKNGQNKEGFFFSKSLFYFCFSKSILLF
jgi:hypothetical protein